MSKALEDHRSGFTTGPQTAMTTAYSAPEVLDPKEQDGLPYVPTLKPDVYAFGGIILFVSMGSQSEVLRLEISGRF